MKLLALAAALGALTTAPAHAAKPAYSLAAAKRLVAVANLRMKLLGGSPVRVEPGSVNRVLCLDFTRDGRTDLAFTIARAGPPGTSVSRSSVRRGPAAGGSRSRAAATSSGSSASTATSLAHS